MNRREITIPERPAASAAVQRKPPLSTIPAHSIPVAKTYSSKRKIEDENGATEVEENGVRLKVWNLLLLNIFIIFKFFCIDYKGDSYL